MKGGNVHHLWKFLLGIFVCFAVGGICDAYACTSDQIDVNGDGSVCENTKFSVTTTNLNANDSLNFSMSATGTFYVDCGDDGTLTGAADPTDVSDGNTITRSGTTSTTYTCAWSGAGAKTIRFGGVATGYNTNGAVSTIGFHTSDANAQKIASLNGNLSTLFPQLGTTPGTGEMPSFYSAFYLATNLTSIPNTLFNGYTVGNNSMFRTTFYSCTGLTSLPDGLFSTFTIGAENMFYRTFRNCSNLSGYIPSSMFAGLIANNAIYKSEMMEDVFFGNNLATSCNNYTGTTRYVTPYDKYWNGKVSCAVPGTGYNLTYACGDGSGTPPIETNQYSSTATTLNNRCSPPSGKAFSTWRCGNTNVGAGDTFAINSNTTCTAQYTNDTINITYSCGDGSGNAPTDNTVYGSGATIKTLANTCTAPSNKEFFGYSCNGTHVSTMSTFVASSDTVCTAQWVEPKFSMNLSAKAYYGFNFSLSATGTFTVDCGDGGVLSGDGVLDNVITRNDTTETTYTCTYSTSGGKTIIFDGVATGYNTGRVSVMNFYVGGVMNTDKIESISGNLSRLFPQLGTGAGQIPRFIDTFRSASYIMSIPNTLFSGYTVAASYMFHRTFYGCSNLASIPYDFFATFTTGAPYMFFATFRNCTGLSSIPDNLFATFTTGASNLFHQTFYGCSSLSGYIPPTLFAGLIANNVAYQANMMLTTFAGTNLATSCDNYTGTTRYVTPYDSYWNGKVSCAAPNTGSTITYSCGTGSGTAPVDTWQYAPNVNATTSSTVNTCAKTDNTITGWTCGNNNTALGGTFTINADTTCTAQWNECAACNATNASCSLSVVDNVCTYATSCNNGYGNISDNGTANASCSANVITIVWNGASSEDIAANNAGTTTYGGDIRTPRAATPIPGKIFRGWKFVKPNQN